MNPESPLDATDPRRLISALADGEADASEFAQGCAAWADADTRLTWHAYHLIGDVLRSDDLASAPEHDRVFLDRLRASLANEPAVLAPQPLLVATSVAARRRVAWRVPAAMAAGVMALAAALVVTRGQLGAEAPSAPTLAAAPVDSQARPGGAVAVATSPPQTMAQGSRIVRDAQLDRYLLAHREYGATLPGSLPGGSGRSMTTVSFER